MQDFFENSTFLFVFQRVKELHKVNENMQMTIDEMERKIDEALSSNNENGPVSNVWLRTSAAIFRVNKFLNQTQKWDSVIIMLRNVLLEK